MPTLRTGESAAYDGELMWPIRYAAWENKIYIVLCGGKPGLSIVTRPQVALPHR